MLSITINDTDRYIKTQWNMVANHIDGIGKTKFWYQQIPIQTQEQIVVGDNTSTEEDLVCQIYVYDK